MSNEGRWRVVSETTTESQLEHYTRFGGAAPRPINAYGLDSLCARTHILVLENIRTGRLKTIKTRI